MHRRTGNARRVRSKSTRTDDRSRSPSDWSDRVVPKVDDRGRGTTHRTRYKHHIVSCGREEKWKRSVRLIGESLWRASVRWTHPWESRREASYPRRCTKGPCHSLLEMCREYVENIECVRDRSRTSCSKERRWNPTLNGSNFCWFYWRNAEEFHPEEKKTSCSVFPDSNSTIEVTLLSMITQTSVTASVLHRIVDVARR